MKDWLLGDGRRPMRHGAAQMRGDALAAQENLDGPHRDASFDLLMQIIQDRTRQPEQIRVPADLVIRASSGPASR